MTIPVASAFPQKGEVTGHLPDGAGVQVLLTSGQGFSLPAQVMTSGPQDAVRGGQDPLPTIGTWVKVDFLNGDLRNAVVTGSFPVNRVGAYAAPQNDPHTRAELRYSGSLEYSDSSGSYYMQLADGSQWIFGFGGTAPVVDRFVVQNGTRERSPFTFAQRVPKPPAAFPLVVELASGFQASISGGGGTSVSMPGTLAVQASSDINLLTSSGTIGIGAVAEALYRLIDERFVLLYNSHVHEVVGVGEPTLPPTVPMVIGEQTTTTLYAG